MAFGAFRDEDQQQEDWQEIDNDADRGVRGRVRLPLFTWEGLIGFALLVMLCVYFADEAPSTDGAIALNGHTGMVETVQFSRDGQTVITSSWDKTVRLWEAGSSTERGQELACLPGNAETYAAVLSPDGRTVASAGLGGLTIWNWKDGGSFPTVNPLFGPCRALAYAPDGQSLAVGGFDQQIRIWEPNTQRVRAVLSGHNDVIRSLAFAADGSLLVSQSFDGALKFWDVKNGREVDRLDGRNRDIHAFSLSPDGRTIALSRLGGSECRIEIWDLTTNTLKLVCPGHAAEVHALVFSPDGRRLASAGGDQEIRFWDPETGEAAGKLDRKLGWVRSLDFSKDGHWVAYSGNFAQVYLKRVDPHGDPSSAAHHS